jgi:tRNA threonylcarbamoyl adenosine modification protein (Sua5/YciO/YrdC/YwlC family)
VKRWKIDDAPNRVQIEEIADVLLTGGVVLLPTDTIYGLHAIRADEDAVARVADIKGRDEAKRFVTLAASIDQLESLGAELPRELRNIWPAPVTAVIRCAATTVAVRIPDLRWLRALLERSGPLISTSANRSGGPPIVAPQDLDPELLNLIDGVVDAGRREGKASAIVDFTGSEPVFVREGEPRFTQMLRKRLLKKL